MVICAVVGCSNKSCKQNKGVSFYRLPTVITHHDENTKELTEKRQNLWLSRIRRADLKRLESQSQAVVMF